MQLIGLLLCCTVLAAASPRPPKVQLPPGLNLAGFENASIGFSASGKSICVTGQISVTVTANNTKLLIPPPQNQTAATDLTLQLFQTNPTIYQTGSGGPRTFTATYNIASQLCVPADVVAAAKVQTVQVLTHGASLDRGYWDISSPNLSYVDAATAAGYATLAYSRLGVGGSSHPDPLQDVQVEVQFEVLHALVVALRGGLGGRKWSKVVSTAHSFGALIANGAVGKYPNDFDAVVLTGASSNTTFLPNAIEVFDGEIGALHGLPNAYLTPTSQIGYQFALFKFPYFSDAVLAELYAERQTYTIGELFTVMAALTPAAAYTGPVDVVLGKYDLPFCGSDCTYPTDLAAGTLATLYPNANKAGSRTVILDQQGHALNGHYRAPEAYAQITAFLKANGL